MVSVIVCTYNREKFITQCLRSIARQSANYETFELIFVNNNSTDTTEEIFFRFKREHPSLQCDYFFEKEPGLSFARNRGIEEAKGAILAFLDDDAIACSDYVERLQSEFANSGFVAGGGKILAKWESKKPDWMGRFLLPLVSVIDLGNKITTFGKNKYPIGANMFFKRSIFENVKGFNTKLGRVGKNMMGGEEKDLFNQIREFGGQVGYFPEIYVHHIIPEERTTKKFIKVQALGVGRSERVRTEKNTTAFFKRLLLEVFKWGGTFVIALGYFLILKPDKAFALIQFRYWITKGLLFKS